MQQKVKNFLRNIEQKFLHRIKDKVILKKQKQKFQLLPKEKFYQKKLKQNFQFHSKVNSDLQKPKPKCQPLLRDEFYQKKLKQKFLLDVEKLFNLRSFTGNLWVTGYSQITAAGQEEVGNFFRQTFTLDLLESAEYCTSRVFHGARFFHQAAEQFIARSYGLAPSAVFLSYMFVSVIL